MFRKRTFAAFALVAAVACADQGGPLGPARPGAPSGPAAPPSSPLPQTELRCVADAAAETLVCAPPAAATDARTQTIIGGQDVYVRLTSTNVSYDVPSQTLSADVTVRNLLPAPQTFGTTDGSTVDAAGVQVFFHQLPSVTSGPGPVSVANEDGTGTFTAAAQPYFQWNEMLRSGDTSAAKRWEFSVPDASTRFVFTVYVATELLYPSGWVDVSAADTVAAGGTTTVTGRLLDEVGNAIQEAGRTLTWAATDGGAFSAPTTDTDATGTATVDLTVGTTAGTQHALSASDAGGLPGPQTDTVTVAAGAATTVVVTVSDTLPTVGSTVTVTAVPQDAFGNAAAPAGDTIDWSATGGGSFAASATATDATGAATVDFTVSSTGGTQHVVTGTYGALSGADTLATKNSAPTATDKAADAIGNVTESYAAPALLQGATDPEGDPLSVVPDTLASANGGHVELSADGSFVYRTAAGFTGTDTFDFVVRDAGGAADTATATITVDSLVWFVDPSAAAGGDGTDAAPFQSPSPLNGAGGSGDVDAPGHVIHLASGSHSGALELEAGQRLVGAGVALTVDGTTLIGATTHPTLDGAGAASTITLGSNNAIHGVHVVNSSGGGVTGSGFGTLTLSDGRVAVTGGPALDLSTGTLAVTLDSVASTNSTSTGIRIASAGGSFTAAKGSIAWATGTAFSVSGGAASITYGGSIANAAGRSVEVTGRTGGAATFSGTLFDQGAGIDVSSNSGGTVTFSGTGKTLGTGANTAITLASNGATTGVSFLNGGLDISTAGAAGIVASGGSVTVSGPNNSISATNGQALDVSGLSADMAFASLSSTGSGASGVEVVNVSGTLASATTSVTSSTQTAVFVSGSTPTVSLGALTIDNSSTNATGLHVTSTGTVNTTGGSINTGTAGAVAADNAALGIALTSVRSVSGSAPGVQLVSTTGSFTVNGDGSNTSVGGNGSGGTVSGKSGTDGTSNGNGVYLSNASNVTLRRMQLNDHQNHAVYAQNVTNFALDYSTVNGANGTSAAADEGSVKFVDLFGSGSITGSVVSGGLEDNVRLVNSSGTLDRLTIDNTTIGLNSTGSGNDGVLFESTGTATAKLTVNNSRFLGARGDLLQVNVLATSVADLVISGGTSFANAHTNTPGSGGGVTVSFGGTGSAPTLTYRVQGNTFRDANGFGLNLFKGSGGGTMSGSVIGNTFGVAGTANSGSANSSAINVQSQGTGTHTTLIQNNTLYQYNEAGIALLANDGSSTLNATVTGNTTSNGGGFAFAGLYVVAGAAGGDSNTLCLDASSNDFTAGDPFAFSDISLEQYQSTTVRLPSYAGGQFSTANVTSYLQGRNTGTPDVFVNTNNTGGGFVNGTCATP